jgi:hypothetical protein
VNIRNVNAFSYLNGFTLTEINSSTPPGNLPPTVNAGADTTITLPANSLTLNGSASDSDGTLLHTAGLNSRAVTIQLWFTCRPLKLR